MVLAITNAINTKFIIRNRIGGCHISLAVRSRPMPTPHLPLLHTSAIILHTSSFLQLFHNHSYGHTFPITEKTSEPKVHKVSRYSRIFRIIELSHFSLLFFVSFKATVPCGFPQGLIIIIGTDSSSYTVPSFPEVF